ncbi:hypothetical protein AAF712_015109 [Marasmius tenuissimus]|uniref:Uncharacterized protein n=1 Tax=Marasmius tenuissimus TaxID=585030 RepID=A0ABR2Z9G6_9AGAR
MQINNASHLLNGSGIACQGFLTKEKAIADWDHICRSFHNDAHHQEQHAVEMLKAEEEAAEMHAAVIHAALNAHAHATLKQELSEGVAMILLAQDYNQALGANAEMQMAYQLRQTSLEDSE